MEPQHESARPRPLSRRTVVSGAGHAVWVTPVILVASTAPAMAASGAPEVRASNIVSARANNQLTVAVTLTNEGSADTSGLMVAVRFNDSTTATNSLTEAPTNVTGGFAYVGIDAPTSTDRTYRFTKADPQLTGSASPAGAMATLGFKIRVYPLVAGNYLGSITVTPTPTGAQGGTGIPAGPTPYS